MPAAARPVPKKPGPKTPEGKARSRMNALKHGLRAREFGLLPEEGPAEWAEHLAELARPSGPPTPFEEKLVGGIAVAMWKEIRADRVECDVLTEIPPAPGRGHGGDLQEPRHAASLTTAIRYQTAAGMAVMRAQRALLAHRKAKKDGLAPEIARAVPVPPEPANQNRRPEPADERAAEKCTNEFLPGTSEPEPPGAPGRVASRTGGDALDDQAWVASLPVVEADPEREARRRELLLQVEPAILRRAIGHAPLAGIENYLSARHGRLRGMVRAPAQAAARGTGEPGRHRPGAGRPRHPAQSALDQGRVPVLLAAAGAEGAARPPGHDAGSGRAQPKRPSPRRRRSPPRSPSCAPGSPGCSTAAPRGGPTSSIWPRRFVR